MLRCVYLSMSDCNEWFVSDNLFRLQLLLFLHYFRISGLYSLAFAALIVEYCKWFVSDNFRISGPHSLAFAAKRRILIVTDLFQIISWPPPHWTRLSSPARPLSGARLAAEVRVEVARLYTVQQAAVLYTCQLYTLLYTAWPSHFITVPYITDGDTEKNFTTHNILSLTNTDIKSLFSKSWV